MAVVNPTQRSPLLRQLEQAPRWAIHFLCIGLIAVAGVADWYSGLDIAFTAIYLLPISLAAWMLSRRAMLAITFACAGTWLLADLAVNVVPRIPLIEVVNLVMELGIFLMFGFLLESLRHRLAIEHELARTDVLTGLRNRRAFWDAAEVEIERCRRFGQPFSVAYLDVDDFKGVNDRLGHRAGDELLQAIANTLQSGVRRIDVVARLGGDEFGLLLPGTDERGARVVMSKLREQLTAGLHATFRVGCSTGCLSVLQAPKDADELVARADAVMYAAKHDGNGQLRHETFPRPHEVAEPKWILRRAISGEVAS